LITAGNIVKKYASLFALLLVTAVLLSACSSEGTSGQAVNPKPPPNVRVQALPSATASPEPPQPEIAPTSSPQPTEQVYYYDPTPDPAALESEIEAVMDDIDKKLNSQDLLLKP